MLETPGDWKGSTKNAAAGAGSAAGRLAGGVLESDIRFPRPLGQWEKWSGPILAKSAWGNLDGAIWMRYLVCVVQLQHRKLWSETACSGHNLALGRRTQ